MRIVRNAFPWAIAYLVLFFAQMLFPGHLHRRDFDHAYFEWRKNPTPQTEAALRVQQRKNDVVYTEIAAVGALVLTGVCYGLYAVVRYGFRRITRVSAPKTKDNRPVIRH